MFSSKPYSGKGASKMTLSICAAWTKAGESRGARVGRLSYGFLWVSCVLIHSSKISPRISNWSALKKGITTTQPSHRRMRLPPYYIILYSILYTPYSMLYTLYSMYTIYDILYTIYSILYTTHTLYTICYRLCTLYFILPTIYYMLLAVAHEAAASESLDRLLTYYYYY